jgi:undecaprenyl-diphosphatase
MAVTGGDGRGALRTDLAIVQTPAARRWPLLVTGLGLVGIVVTAPIAATGSPSSAETAVFEWFNDPPGALGAVAGLVNPLLRPLALTLLMVGVVAALFVSRRRVFRPLITHAAGAGIVAYLIANGLKRVVDRGRPPVYLPNVLVHGYPVDPSGSGYPSSHTSVAVSVVVGAWPWLNLPWKVAGVTAAAAIALNRMYVGAHLPLDILGGVAVGLLSGGLVLVSERSRPRSIAT